MREEEASEALLGEGPRGRKGPGAAGAWRVAVRGTSNRPAAAGSKAQAGGETRLVAEGQTTDVWRGHGVPYSCAQDQNRALARQRRDRLTGEEVGELAWGKKAGAGC